MPPRAPGFSVSDLPFRRPRPFCARPQDGSSAV